MPKRKTTPKITIKKDGKPKCDRAFKNGLWLFLKLARSKTYASGLEPLAATTLPGFKQYRFEDGNWLYQDIFAGSKLGGGQEIVFYNNIPVWYMNYGGGLDKAVMNDDKMRKIIHACLKEALSNTDQEFRPCGPYHLNNDGGYIYSSWLFELGGKTINDADIGDFCGQEALRLKINGYYERVFASNFHGGFFA